MTVEEQENVEFSATVTGLPKPKVVWKVAGETIESSQGNYTISESDGRHTLKISSVEKRHAGSVEVQASNDFTSDKAGAELTVKAKQTAPVFRTKLQDKSVDEGQPVRFEVTLENPTPDTKVRFSLNGKELKPGVDGVEIGDNGNGTYYLSIPKATPDLSGQLNVTAENSIGSNSSDARVSLFEYYTNLCTTYSYIHTHTFLFLSHIHKHTLISLVGRKIYSKEAGVYKSSTRSSIGRRFSG